MVDRCWRVPDRGVLVERADVVALVRSGGYRFHTPEGGILERGSIYYLVDPAGEVTTFTSRMGESPVQEGYIDLVYVVEGHALCEIDCSWDWRTPFADRRPVLAGL